MSHVKVRDDKAWQEQLTEFEADNTSRQFRDILVFWMDTTEKVIEESDWYARDFTFVACARKAFEVTEQTFGFISVEWIGQLLLVFVQHWYFGQQLYDELTYLEKRMVEQATAMKLAELQMMAAQSASLATESE